MKCSFLIICLLSGFGLFAARNSNASRVRDSKVSSCCSEPMSQEIYWCEFAKEAREAINSASTACELLLLERRYGLLIVAASEAEYRNGLFNYDQQEIIIKINEFKDFYFDFAVELSLLLNVYIRKICAFGSKQKMFHKNQSKAYRCLRDK